MNQLNTTLQKRIVQRVVPDQPADFSSQTHPVMKRIYLARHVFSASELDGSLKLLLPFSSLKGIEQAAAIIADAITCQKKILVIGDFDADGATSCAVAVRALRMLGARQSDFLVPDRFRFGYGLTPEIVEVAREKTPELIITVDNGISSIQGVEAAKGLGIDVVVTDHHLPGDVLPQADAIVNPNQPGDMFPSKHLAGVGVIFYVMLAVRAHLRQQGWFESSGMADVNLATLLDLVALGTVADVVPLDHNNRILVSQGIARIRAGRCCPGVQALLAVANRKLDNVVAADLGFAVGPRLNAAGRLDDMSLGIHCLLEDDAKRANQHAARLDQLNQERRDIETDMKQQAQDLLASLAVSEGEAQFGLALFDERWHQGVIGILASRIKDQVHRPVIAFAEADGDEIKGSARSISGLHIRDVLDTIAGRHPGLLVKFGGHAMAAGLSIKRADFERFRQAFNETVREQVDEHMFEPIIYTDGELTARELDLNFAEHLRNQGPWGQGFPEPVFEGVFKVLSHRLLKEKHLKMELATPDGSRRCEAIAFDAKEHHPLANGSPIRLVYRLDINEFRGARMPQLLVQYIESNSSPN